MRDIIVVFSILTLIIGGSICTHSFYENTRNDFDKKLNVLAETLETNIDKDEKINDLEEFWKSKEDVLIIFQEHEAIDEIEDCLYECFHYYRISEKDHFELAKANLLKRMEDLVKREHLKLVNLF